MDATLVLDFLWACLHLPHTFRGRDKNLPRHHEVEDILALTDRQLAIVLDYVIEECAGRKVGINPSTEKSKGLVEEGILEWSPLGLDSKSSSLKDEESREERVKQRMGLLLLCVAENTRKLRNVVDGLLERGRMETDKERLATTKLILMELYFVKSEEVSAMIPVTSINTVSTAVHSSSNKVWPGKVAEGKVMRLSMMP